MSKTPEQILAGYGITTVNHHYTEIEKILNAMTDYANQEIEKALAFVNKDIQTKNRGPYENR